MAAHPSLEDALGRISTVAQLVTVEENGTGRRLVIGNTHLFYHPQAVHVRILQAHQLLTHAHRAVHAEASRRCEKSRRRRRPRSTRTTRSCACPAPSRGSAGLAGVSALPARLPHPWGATSCRKAPPRSLLTSSVYASIPLRERVVARLGAAKVPPLP